MSRGTSLSSQSTRVNLIIRKNQPISIDKLKSYCDTYCSKYAFIEHKGDIEPTTGLVVGVHYHLVLLYKDNKISFSTRLNTICDWFGFDNAIGIQIDKIITLEGSIQYLIHKNNPEKTQHDINEIVSNYDKKELSILMESTNGDVITFDRLLQAVMIANKKSDIIKEIGLGYSRNYWRLIEVLWEDYH